jgi:nucleoside-diphosphate kinase
MAAMRVMDFMERLLKNSQVYWRRTKSRSHTLYSTSIKDSFPMERTFLMIKPDGVQRRLVGEIIRRFEQKGFTLVALQHRTASREQAEAHYGVHRDKPFFAGVVAFITSGPVVTMVWEGNDVIALARKLMGATKPADSLPGTIRGDYADSIEKNLIHGSDSVETAGEEISLWFPDLA